jgi:hypothetical protein
MTVPDMPAKITEPIMLTWASPPHIQPTEATRNLGRSRS